MHHYARVIAIILFSALVSQVLVGCKENNTTATAKPSATEDSKASTAVQLGPRPFFLIDDMQADELKENLKACENMNFAPSKFSIGHRGAPLQFPEHTRESYVAAAKMGAGILECDVTFTKDKELVCRHSQCDLHSTTNILQTELAQKCSTPPDVNQQGELTNASEIQCCTSDITLREFKSLQGKMDAANTTATSLTDYMNATPDWRTDLYSSRGTLMTHEESIQLFDQLGTDFTPELKSPAVTMPYQQSYSQEEYAQAMINAYKNAGIPPERVWPQSFNYQDILYWINNTDYGDQAVYLVEDNANASLEEMQSWYKDGVRVLAPALWMLVTSNEQGEIIPSQYALNSKKAGFKIITWTLERSGHLKNGDWYYQTLDGSKASNKAVSNDGDMFRVLDVLAQKVGVIGVFSDWPATTTYYANCMKELP